MPSLKGCIVTVDALNCQRGIAQQIIDQGGDYTLPLKGNQGTLHADVGLFLTDPKSRPQPPRRPTPRSTAITGGSKPAPPWSPPTSPGCRSTTSGPDWPPSQGVARVRELPTKTETAYYLLNAPLSAERFGHAVRSHWGRKNRLHWCLDVIMNEDQARNRLDNGPQNLAVLRHMALKVMSKDKTETSLRGKFKLAGPKDDYLAEILPQF
jgi:predicted transposase YbfD/YdcC